MEVCWGWRTADEAEVLGESVAPTQSAAAARAATRIIAALLQCGAGQEMSRRRLCKQIVLPAKNKQMDQSLTTSASEKSQMSGQEGSAEIS